MMKQYHHPDLADVSLATVLQALADPCRVAVVCSMMEDEDRERACNEIPLSVGKATRSHHFEVLRSAGLIQTRVEGTKCLSRLRRREIEDRFPGLLALVQQEYASHPRR